MVEKEINYDYEITLELDGIKLDYHPKDESESASLRRIAEMLEIKKRHKEVTIIDALRTIANSSLAEKIADKFEKEVNRKKRDYLISIGCCIGLYVGVEYIDVHPVIEGIGKTISGIGAISAVCLYYNAFEAGKVVHYFLREKI